MPDLDDARKALLEFRDARAIKLSRAGPVMVYQSDKTGFQADVETGTMRSSWS